MRNQEQLIKDIKLVDDLREKGSFQSKRLACKILDGAAGHYHRYISPSIYRKAEQVLYSLFDEETLNLLKEYNRYIKNQVINITSEEPWCYSDYDYSFTYYDNFKNMHDYEFRTFDTYHVERTTEGYEPYDKDPYNWYFQRILDVEEEFLRTHAEELNGLHIVLSLREELFEGNFRLKDEKDRELAMELVSFLGNNLVTKPRESKPKTNEFTK